MVQLPGILRLEGDLQNRRLLRWILDDRWKVAGKRLQDIKAKHLVQEGEVFWADAGSYCCKWNDAGKLISVEHRPTGHA
eukprot:7413820-Alexandrium_andersonii.AAC.1